MQRLVVLMLTVLGVMAPDGSIAGDADAKSRAMIDRYVGTWAIAEFLEEPAIRGELRALLGDRLSELENSLSVSGGIEYFGGALAIRGNAPHSGGEQEGIVCVQVWGTNVEVHAALFSKGDVTVYTRQPRYAYLSTCVKDWIALVSTGHAYRLSRPPNVHLESRPREEQTTSSE